MQHAGQQRGVGTTSFQDLDHVLRRARAARGDDGDRHRVRDRTREPEVVFDASKIQSEADWIAAGELLFNNPTSFGPVFFGEREVRLQRRHVRERLTVASDRGFL